MAATSGTEQSEGVAGESGAAGERRPWDRALPVVGLRDDSAVRPGDGAGVVAALDRLAKRGKLPGFMKVGSGGGGEFEVAAFGMLYDRVLRGRVEGDRVRFGGRLKRGLPIGVAVGFVLTLYPGVLLTDTLLNMWFRWYPQELWVTVAWYVPLTLLAAPALWAQFKASERASRRHAEETIAKIATALGGDVVVEGGEGEGVGDLGGGEGGVGQAG